MKHYGDITKINGADVPIVDIICGGSPCQDLSVAGKRAGLDGERSGLFMEQIRIVKEQRNEYIRQLRLRGADIDVRSIKPRFLVWENVPGAFSSNKGEDFRCVLEEICRIADKTANVPMPEKGKWSTSGCIVGDGWSVAWRVHDAQFWGVPQRRKRIALVADFGSESAGEILFERESVSGDIKSSVKTGEEVAGTITDSTNKAISFQERAGCPGGGKGILIQNEKTASIRTQNNQSVCYGMDNVPVVIEGNGSRESHRGDGYKESEISYTLNSTEVHGVCHEEPTCIQRRFSNVNLFENGITPTLEAGAGEGGNNMPMVCYGLDRASFNQGQNAQYDFSVEEEKAQTLVSRGPGGGTSETVGALCAVDYKGAGNQYVTDGKLIIQNIPKNRTP